MTNVLLSAATEPTLAEEVTTEVMTTEAATEVIGEALVETVE